MESCTVADQRGVLPRQQHVRIARLHVYCGTSWTAITHTHTHTHTHTQTGILQRNSVRALKLSRTKIQKWWLCREKTYLCHIYSQHDNSIKRIHSASHASLSNMKQNKSSKSTYYNDFWRITEDWSNHRNKWHFTMQPWWPNETQTSERKRSYCTQIPHHHHRSSQCFRSHYSIYITAWDNKWTYTSNFSQFQNTVLSSIER